MTRLQASLASNSTRRTRQDALPETMRYRDSGCDLFASCLSCPLPRCRHDVPGGVRVMISEMRDDEMRQLRDRDVPINDLARRFQVSRRTVHRVLASGAG